MRTSRLLLLGLVLSPVVLLPQKKEDLQSIQRDVVQLDEHIKALQSSQDAKMAALQSILQQALEASSKTAQILAAFERDVSSKMNDQQSKLVATLGSKVDQMADDIRSLSTNMAELIRRFNKLDSTLADISNAIRTLPTPTPAPAVPTSAATPGPPAGMSAESSFQSAYRDYMGGKDELAQQEFADYLKYYDKTENAPSAQYYIGMIYYRGNQFDDAVKAFDAVLERYPENSRTQESLYQKALALSKASRRTEAGRVFQEYLRRYPHGDHVANAHQNLKSLGLEPARTGKKRD